MSSPRHPTPATPTAVEPVPQVGRRSPGSRAPAEHTRNRILQEALALLVERGFAAATLRELARRLGFSVAALYYYYPAKDDLLRDVLAPYHQRLDQIISVAAASEDPVGEVLNKVLESVLDDPARSRVANIDISVRAHPEQGMLLESQLASLRRLLGSSPDVDGSELLTSAALGVLVRPAINIDDIDPETARDQLIPAARRVLAPLPDQRGPWAKTSRSERSSGPGSGS